MEIQPAVTDDLSITEIDTRTLPELLPTAPILRHTTFQLQSPVIINVHNLHQRVTNANGTQSEAVSLWPHEGDLHILSTPTTTSQSYTPGTTKWHYRLYFNDDAVNHGFTDYTGITDVHDV